MTVEGEESLRTELQHLITDVRPNITKKIAEAREFGDLKENAEYHAAKEQQGLTEARIREIEGKLSASQIIDIKKIECTGRVIFGSTVSLLDMQNDEKISYQIVGEDEANVKMEKYLILPLWQDLSSVKKKEKLQNLKVLRHQRV